MARNTSNYVESHMGNCPEF